MTHADTPTRPTPAQNLTVEAGQAGQRIDNFLRTRLKGVPRERIYRILRRGEVRVNRGRIRQDYRLRAGDVVRIPPLRMAAPRAEAPAPRALLARVRESVLWQDGDLLVVDKPSGLAVHGGSGRSFGLIEALRAAFPELRQLELVHRLDKETSGCLLIAKRRSALRALHAALREQRVDKRYLALVSGRVQGAREVDAALRKNVLRSGERVVRVDEEGKHAQTRLRALRAGSRATLVEARILTGRTHQIRVHAASIGHPLAGDAKYGDREFNQAMRALGLRRLFLHAHELRFAHPTSSEAVSVRSPLPLDLAAVLSALGLA